MELCGQLHDPAALPPGKSPRYPFYRRFGGPHSRSGTYGEGKIFYPTGTQTPAPLVVQLVACRYTDWVIPAPEWKTCVSLVVKVQIKTIKFMLSVMFLACSIYYCLNTILRTGRGWGGGGPSETSNGSPTMTRHKNNFLYSLWNRKITVNVHWSKYSVMFYCILCLKYISFW
jgi:hypothetical protein